AERNRVKDEDSDDDEAPRKKTSGGSQPLLWFSSPLLPTNTYFGIYKAIFTAEELKNESAIADVIRQKQLEPLAVPKPAKDGTLPPAAYKGPHIFLCMIGGGHFAAMVVSLAPKKSHHGHGMTMNREAT